jgi:superfamily II DNA or RNA helicase
MSRKVDINTLSDDDLKTISKDLQVYQKPSKYAFNAKPTCICLFEAEGEDVYVPFAYSQKYPRPERKTFPVQEVHFEGQLREPQKEVKNEAIQNLNKYGSTIISSYTGFGKTILAIYIASRIKMKTLIICHRIVLINQWKIAIQRFCPTATTQILTTQSEMEDVDFYIINATTIPKHRRDFYKEIGMVVVDEMHIIMAEKMSHCMRYLTPRYVLGLSATPYRNDGLDILLDMYFGTKKIIRKLWRKHTVYRIDTGFKPDVKLNRMGKVDWGSVIESQSNCTARNELIVNLIKNFPTRVFLILCKRVAQANYLYTRLKEEGEDVTSLIGSQQIYEQKSRVLVGTAQKTGVGFDHPRLDSLVLASDVEQYFVQYLGRVFRREDVEPFIFDIVDDYALLYKHYRTRNSVYVEHGGIVKDFKHEFPKIKL